MTSFCSLITSHCRNTRKRNASIHVLAAALLLFWATPLFAQYADDSVIVIDTTKRTLAVLKDGKPKLTFDNISIGKGGPATLRKRGDGKTPLGEFKIISINRNSRYHLFFGLDFPNLDYAERAFDADLIDESEYREIYLAYKRKSTPPQNTRLGGHIGIHGIGRGDLSVHESFNWTDGCIALTNEQINQLAKWINIGTKVIISS